MFSSYPLLLCQSRFLHTFAHYPCTLRALGLFWIFWLFGASFFLRKRALPRKEKLKDRSEGAKTTISPRARQTGHWRNPGPIAKTDFWAVVCFSPKLKTAIFTYVIPVGTRSIVIVGHFLWHDRSHQVSLTMLQNLGYFKYNILTIVEWPKTGMSPRKWPLPRKKNLGGIYFKVAADVLVLCPFDKKLRFQNKK